MFLVYRIKSAMLKLFLGLHYVNKLFNFHGEAFFIKGSLVAQIKILESKEILQSVLNNLIG